MLAFMDSFQSCLSDWLDLPKVSNVGYYLRGGKKVWLKDSQDLLEVLEQIGSKGRGSIWYVVKKTVMTSLEQRRSVMGKKGEREFKKDMKHLRSIMAPNILALNIGFGQRHWKWAYTQMCKIPHVAVRLKALLQRAQRSPMNEAITDLAKVITGVMQKGHKTPPLRSSPMKQVGMSPNVSRPCTESSWTKVQVHSAG